MYIALRHTTTRHMAVCEVEFGFIAICSAHANWISVHNIPTGECEDSGHPFSLHLSAY